jgi:hypothetical protein
LAIPDDYPFTSVSGLNVLVAPQGKTPRCGNVNFKCAEGNHEAGKYPCDDMWNKVKTLLTEDSFPEGQTSLQDLMETSNWLVNASFNR